jgi:hypothetical protein
MNDNLLKISHEKEFAFIVGGGNACMLPYRSFFPEESQKNRGDG